MRTYRELFQVPEFSALFGVVSAHISATTVSSLALGTLVYSSTHSPLLSAISIFGPQLAQLAGAVFLMSAADRLPPRAALTGLGLLFAVGMATMAVPGLPVWAVFPIIFTIGLIGSVGGGVRFGLLNEILPDGGYLLGRSVLNMSVGTMQIVGFGVGGVLVTTLSPRGTLLAAAALDLAAAAVARFGLRRRPPRSAGRPSVRATWQGNARLWSSVPRRYVYLALWVPNGLIVGCESLYVAYDAKHAGLLFACAAFGMLIGDTLTGRFVPAHWRARLGPPLRLLLAAPYLVFVVHPALAFAVAAVVLASIGYSASLLLQERLLALTPDDMHGQALGLNSSGLMAGQGLAAVLAGTIAQHTSAATAMTTMAVASVAVTLALAPGLTPLGVPRPEPSARQAEG